MILQVDCKGALDLTYGWNISGLTKHVSVQACFLCELKEVNLLLCIWLPTNGRFVYEKHVTMFLSLSLMYHHDDNDDDENCHQHLHKILDISHITITYSPGEGVGTGQLWELATNCIYWNTLESPVKKKLNSIPSNNEIVSFALRLSVFMFLHSFCE